MITIDHDFYRNLVRIAITLLLLGSLTGCGQPLNTMYRTGPTHTGVYADQTGISQDPKIKWQYDLGASTRSSPVIKGDTLYICDDKGNIHALNKTNGELKWLHEGTHTIVSTPVADHSKLTFGSMDGHIYSLYQAHRKTHFKINTGAPVQASGILVRWKFAEGAISREKEVFLIGSTNGRFYAIDHHRGRILWQFQAKGAITATPAVADGMVFFGTHKNMFYALQLGNGKPVWQVQTSGAIEKAAAIISDRIYFGSNDHHLYELDRFSGKLLWKYEFHDAVKSTPTVTRNTVYVGVMDGTLYAIEHYRRRIVWRFHTGDWVNLSPILADNTLYFASYDRFIYAAQADTGMEIFRFKADAPIAKTLNLHDGSIYFSSLNGKVYAIE